MFLRGLIRESKQFIANDNCQWIIFIFQIYTTIRLIFTKPFLHHKREVYPKLLGYIASDTKRNRWCMRRAKPRALQFFWSLYVVIVKAGSIIKSIHIFHEPVTDITAWSCLEMHIRPRFNIPYHNLYFFSAGFLFDSRTTQKLMNTFPHNLDGGWVLSQNRTH